MSDYARQISGGKVPKPPKNVDKITVELSVDPEILEQINTKIAELQELISKLPGAIKVK